MKKTKLCALALATFICIGCFAACSSDDSSSSTLETSKVESDTKTWATNFKGIITETGDDGFVYKNYYLNQNEWVIGDGVVLPSYSEGKAKDYMRFLDCNNRSLFGPRVRYEDFVCRFSVIMNDIELAGSGASFGLSFNRKTLYSYANDCAGILFMKSDEGTAVRVTQGALDKSSGAIWLQYQEDNAIDLWSEKGGKYDFMIVKSGDTAQIYYAKAGDTEGLKTLRATISGVGGEGLVAMCGLTGVNFQLDSFGVWDLNEVNDELSDYTFNGMATASNNQVVLNREGSLLSANAYEDTAFSYGLKLTAGNSFACMVGNETIQFSSDGTITGSNGLTVVKNSMIDFSVFSKGSAVRLRKVGALIYVDVKGESGYTTRAIFSGAEKQTKFGIKAGVDASLIVDAPAIVSLASVVDIATKDYDPNVDVDPMSPKDISFNEYYGVN
ncbi:MAG: hypothetical protein J6S04_07245 [Clostridia bacterium]|nr:hypothetical protein [Clostridia bacterium]